MYRRLKKRSIMCSVLATTLLLLMAVRFAFVKKQTETEMSLPELDNLQGRLKDIHVLIESEREHILAQEFNDFMAKTCVPARRLVLGIPSTNDFLSFKAYNEVQIFRFSEPIESIRKTVIDHFYRQASNDCKTLWSLEYGTKYMEAKHPTGLCARNITDLEEKHPLPEKAFHNRLPKYLRELPGTADDIITYLSIVKNAIILYNGDIYTEHFVIVPQTCVDWIHPLCPSNVRHGAYYNYSSLEIVDEVFSISQYFSPWERENNLVENLPRIAPYLDFFKRNPQILIHAENSGRHLPALGISADRIIHRDIRAKIVYVPAGTVCVGPPILTTWMLSKALKHNLLPSYAISSQSFSILRNVVLFTCSNFESDDPVLEMLLKHTHQDNLEVITYYTYNDKEMSIELIAEWFGRAVIIVSPMQANDYVIFANPGTILIEGVIYDHDYYEPGDRGMRNLLYSNLATGLGLRYYGLIFQGLDKAKEIEGPFLEALMLYRKGLV